MYFVALASLGAAAAYWNLIFRQETNLRDLCYHLAGDYTRGRWTRGGRAYTFSGRFLGRQFVVAYRYRWRSLLVISSELEIQLPVVQKFWLRFMFRALHRDELDSVENLPIGAAIDPVYVVNSNQPEAAERFLESNAVQTAFRNFRYSFSKMEIYRGWLKVTFSHDAAKRFLPGDIEYFLDLLMPMIANYEEQMLGRTIVIAALPSAVCPFCREELDANRDGIVACTQCQTRLHEACWKENGQCTTWGCTSVTTARV